MNNVNWNIVNGKIQATFDFTKQEATDKISKDEARITKINTRIAEIDARLTDINNGIHPSTKNPLTPEQKTNLKTYWEERKTQRDANLAIVERRKARFEELVAQL